MIQSRGLTKRYGAVVAVADLDFDVPRGETFALIGPNGAGKTTTLKCLLGLARPDSGRMTIGAQHLPPSDPHARTALGYVPQRVDFPADRTATDVLEFFADLRGLDRRVVARTLERVGMTAFAARRAQDLSGGYLQRLSLAQALLGDPDILILDEPTASLDPQATFEFRSLVLDLKSQGKTILLCSHLLSEVERVADRVLILVGGRRAALESMPELHARQLGATRLVIDLGGDRERALRVLTDRGHACESLNGRGLVVTARGGRHLDALEALREAGLAPHSFELQRPTLEDVFLSAVRASAQDAP